MGKQQEMDILSFHLLNIHAFLAIILFVFAEQSKPYFVTKPAFVICGKT